MNSDKKPREWWVVEKPSHNVNAFGNDGFQKCQQHTAYTTEFDKGLVHVIEKSYADAMMQELILAKEALVFYASSENHFKALNMSIPGNKVRTSNIEDEKGKRARTALDRTEAALAECKKQRDTEIFRKFHQDPNPGYTINRYNKELDAILEGRNEHT